VKIDHTELRKGLAQTRQYVFSHHVPSEWYRCYTLLLRGRRIRVCARCLGIYPGIGLGLFAFFRSLDSGSYLIALLPLPALLEWGVTSLTERRGYNLVRTATGALLGYGYGLGLGRLFGGSDVRILGIGVAYGLVAAWLLQYERKRSEGPSGFKEPP
jgi:uncharacterized membrane protein